MGEGENGAEAPAEVPNGDSVYVVQRKILGPQPGGGHLDPAQIAQEMGFDAVVWEDVTTLTVAAKSRRRPTLQKALDEKQIESSPDDVFRLLDARSAEEIPVNSETRLVVG